MRAPEAPDPGPGPRAHPRDRLRRSLGLQDATFLVVASVVGSGIFLTPGAIADRLPHPGLIFAVWIVGGLLSLAGALANAELATLLPRAGGSYVYLREAFHPLAGFLVGWLTFFAIYAGTAAALAVGFAAGLAAAFGWSDAAIVPAAALTVLATCALNARSVRWGAWANNLTGYAKVVALVAFALAGPLFGEGSFEGLRPIFAGASGSATLQGFALALSPVLFSYLGWNATVYVASEIRDPARNLPRSLFLGLAICTSLYLLLNAVYLYAIPVEALGGIDNAGEAAGEALFGPASGRVLAAFVQISILGTLNATVLVGARIAYAMALDGLFPGAVDGVHPRFGTPGVAVWVQGAVALALILLLRNFPSALDFTTFAILLATIADVLALYRLRRTRPEAPRPYRALGYPGVPALYVVVNAAIALTLLVSRPYECAVGLGMLLLGAPFYLALSRSR